MRLQIFMGMVLGLATSPLWAANEFLSPEQAFQFQASSISEQTAELKWDIAPHYYLYHDQFKASIDGKEILLNLPTGQEKDDPTFGRTNVHYQQVTTQFDVQPNQQYSIQWQGCAEDGLCYPVQRTTIQTDATGLLPQQNLTTSSNLSLLAQTSQADATVENTTRNQQAESVNENPDTELQTTEPQSIEQSIQPLKPELNPVSQQNTPTEQPSSSSLQQDWNNDQFFLNLLSSQSIWLNIIIFLGLGILLAFLPCSLPLIPIISGVLVQRNKGYKAAMIALTFVVSMALVYAVMGFVVSQIGFNIQRWFQSPVFISIFALMFIAFALNLFGVYQLSLPQGLLQHLDRIQQGQKGGTLLGAGVMGAVSALIVGPCMSAPLAGALLYVSHLEHSLLGGFYLFLLGLGIGIPLFIASVFGAKYLPKPGLWMERLKFCFGFVMLAMAIYFARPLLPITLYYAAFALIFIVMAGYLFSILRHVVKLPSKFAVLILAGMLAVSSMWQAHLAISSLNSQQSSILHAWTVVKNQQELQQALATHRNQPVLIDVYADWCVACQPIERDVLPQSNVQQAIKGIARIKLDLTHYEASQDKILKEKQILGPPTVLFLEPNHQEQRDLRLTGAYAAHQLIQNIQHLYGGK